MSWTRCYNYFSISQSLYCLSSSRCFFFQVEFFIYVHVSKIVCIYGISIKLRFIYRNGFGKRKESTKNKKTRREKNEQLKTLNNRFFDKWKKILLDDDDDNVVVIAMWQKNLLVAICYRCFVSASLSERVKCPNLYSQSVDTQYMQRINWCVGGHNWKANKTKQIVNDSSSIDLDQECNWYLLLYSPSIFIRT